MRSLRGFLALCVATVVLTGCLNEDGSPAQPSTPHRVVAQCIGRQATLDISNLLTYALDNTTQTFERYPEAWLPADVPAVGLPVSTTTQAAYTAALNGPSLVPEATDGR